MTMDTMLGSSLNRYAHCLRRPINIMLKLMLSAGICAESRTHHQKSATMVAIARDIRLTSWARKASPSPRRLPILWHVS